MSRSLKKGPYINVSLEKKILAMNESGKQRIWLATSLESSLQHVALAVTLVTESKLRVKPFKNLSK